MIEIINSNNQSRWSIETIDRNNHSQKNGKTLIKITTFNGDCITSIQAIRMHSHNDASTYTNCWHTIDCDERSARPNTQQLTRLAFWFESKVVTCYATTCSTKWLSCLQHCNDYHTCLYNHKDRCKCSSCLECHDCHEHVSKNWNLKFRLIVWSTENVKRYNRKGWYSFPNFPLKVNELQLNILFTKEFIANNSIVAQQYYSNCTQDWGTVKLTS